MATNKPKEFIVEFRDPIKSTHYSKTIKADTVSAAIKIVKGICKAAQIMSTRQR